MAVAHSLADWSEALNMPVAGKHAPSELATMLLALNYELLGYSPEQAWMLARRGESAAPGTLDG